MKYIYAFLAVLVPVLASAQVTDAPTSYELRIYNPGASQPTQATPFPASAVTCNLAPPSGAVATNPTTVVWDDPANAGKVCQYNFAVPGPGPIVALPSGNYEGAMAAINTEGSSPESNRAPFTRARPPAALTGVRFTR